VRQKNFYRNLVLPLVIYLGAFLAYPFLFALFISFQRDGAYTLGNFIDLFDNPLFIPAVRNNIIIPLISISLEMILGIALAVIVNRIKKHATLFIVLIMLPFIMPNIVFLTASRFIFSQHGYINGVLVFLGLEPLYWLEPGSALSLVLVSLVDAWRLTPLVFLIILAALKGIPKELEDQAMVDGASPRQCFFFVILPMLIPAIIASLVLRSVDAFRIFATPLVLSGVEGVPCVSTFAYHLWSDYNNASMACAASTILAMLILTISSIYLRLWKRAERIQI